MAAICWRDELETDSSTADVYRLCSIFRLNVCAAEQSTNSLNVRAALPLPTTKVLIL
jgi:hypothetical protein